MWANLASERYTIQIHSKLWIILLKTFDVFLFVSELWFLSVLIIFMWKMTSQPENIRFIVFYFLILFFCRCVIWVLRIKQILNVAIHKNVLLRSLAFCFLAQNKNNGFSHTIIARTAVIKPIRNVCSVK